MRSSTRPRHEGGSKCHPERSEGAETPKPAGLICLAPRKLRCGSPIQSGSARANLTAFIDHITKQNRSGSEAITDFAALYRWSVEHPEQFWPEVWRFCGVIAEQQPGRDPWEQVLTGGDRMAPPDPELGPKWFSGARLNFAENLLRYADDHPAIVFWDERGKQCELSYWELNQQVRRVAEALTRHGIVVGDRIAGFLPNIPETVIAMLASAQHWGGLVLVLTGLRSQRRAGPVRADSAPSALLCRRVPLCGKEHRPASPGARDSRAHSGDRAGGGGSIAP